MVTNRFLNSTIQESDKRKIGAIKIDKRKIREK